MPSLRSLDAWVMSNPSRAFQYMASQRPGDGIWLAVRRPLFLAGVLGCAVSLITTGTLTVRIAVPAAVYWSFVPLVELLALVAVVWGRRRQTSLPTAIDTFFTGQGPWILCLIGVAGTLAFLPPAVGWHLLTTVWLGGVALVVVWSVFIDFCFFRCVFGASRGAAARDVAVLKLLTWTTIFAIFAVPGMSPRGVVQEVVSALKEVLGG